MGIASFIGYSVQPERVLRSGNYVWDTGTLEWIKSTGGTGVGTEVEVTNFPAVQAVSGNFLTDAQLRASAVEITGTVGVLGGTIDAVQSGTWILGANSGVDIGDVTINNAAGGAAVNIQDGGNSITVDGSLGRTWTLASGTDSVAAVQSGTWILGANSGVDIGDVTINNAAGGAAVNIQDGGNSITVDGSVTAIISKVDETPAAPTTATVGVASAEAVAANGSRTGLHLRNTSTSGQRISLGFDGNAAVLDSGYTLYPEDVFDMDGFDFTTGNVTAISSAVSGRLSVQQFA